MFHRLLLAGVFTIGVVLAPATHAGLTMATETASAGVPFGAVPSIPLNTNGCYWANCSEAHQNGEGNIPQGNAHYCAKQDRDDDGIACEW